MVSNPAKCVLRVASDKFLCFMVSYLGIEANPMKIQAIQKMVPLGFIKEIHDLIRKVAAINHFISSLAEKYHRFFKILKHSKDF